MDKTTKSLVMTLLVLGLVLEQQSHAVAARSCCPSTTARNMYNVCRLQGASRQTCARLARCQIVEGRCKDPHYIDQLYPYSDSAEVANVVHEFCKSGCASSMCSNIKTDILREDADEAMDRCGEACYRFCTKHVNTATNNVS